MLVADRRLENKTPPRRDFAKQGRRKRKPETLLLVHADVSRLFYEFTAPLGIFGFLGSCNADGPA
jgi:hypothetical protein